MTDRIILAVKFTPASAPREAGRAVGGFLRYIHYRDKHSEAEARVVGELKYAAHRDRSVARGRLFGPQGTATDGDRRDLAEYVARSLRVSSPHATSRAGEPVQDRRRAIYRFVLSPENARGLDLQELARVAIGRLEQQLGCEGLRWIAAEHRNTAHPHVHIVLAGMHESGLGRFRAIVLTRPRLASMKEALGLEIDRQRGMEPRSAGLIEAATDLLATDVAPSPEPTRSPAVHPRGSSQPARVVWTFRIRHRSRHAGGLVRLGTLAKRYRRQLEQEAAEERARAARERVR